MGLFDLPSPALTWINQHLLAWAPAWLQLLLWSLLGAWLCMALFRRLSRQQDIAELKQQVRSRQRQIAAFDGEMGELWPLVGQTLMLASRQLKLTLGPAVLASLPLVFLLAFQSREYGFEFPRAGEALAVQVSSTQPADIRFEPGEGARIDRQGRWEIRWPAAGSQLAMLNGDTTLVRFPLAEPVPLVHRKKWWNILLGNPLGYLPADGRIQALGFDLPRQRILHFGPNWMQGWWFLSIASLVVFSMAFKFALKIQ